MQTPTARLDMLLEFLEQDPANPALLTDAADAAVAARQPDVATRLMARLPHGARGDARQRHVAGLVAMQERRFEAAVALFAGLIEEGEAAPALSFNLAWALAMTGQKEAALDRLDAAAVAALAPAAMLKVQLLHEADRAEEAMAAARDAIVRHSDDPGLLAAVSVLATDAEDVTLAAACAKAAGDHPDALTTLGTLALTEDNATGARVLFDRALAANQDAPRAWIGRGLTKLLTGETADAASDIDRGAAIFADHLGSWVAAGWAHILAGDRGEARARFETALAIDDTFGETHGSLAVLDILEGNIAGARERAKISHKLDGSGYAGALAQTLLAAGNGDPAKARKILESALTAPIDGSGRTIAQALARMGLS